MSSTHSMLLDCVPHGCTLYTVGGCSAYNSTAACVYRFITYAERGISYLPIRRSCGLDLRSTNHGSTSLPTTPTCCVGWREHVPPLAHALRPLLRTRAYSTTHSLHVLTPTLLLHGYMGLLYRHNAGSQICPPSESMG